MEETQQQTLEKYKEAVSIGLNILDSHFEEVVLLESSDSDDETSDSNPALVLRPKTRYTKPLPLTIGSAEWWADDNVGLGEFQENEDSEPELTLSNSEPDVVHQSQVEKRLIVIFYLFYFPILNIFFRGMYHHHRLHLSKKFPKPKNQISQL